MVVDQSFNAIIESYLINFEKNYIGSGFELYTSIESAIINPIRDMVIAILFAYLYYYKGMKDMERQR
jgi:hypothetical protein